MSRFLVVAECSCHRWVCDMNERIRPCGRCKEQPRVTGRAEGAVTVCLHDGPCGRRALR